MDELKNDILDILNESLKIKNPRPKKIKNIWTKIKEKITIPEIITLENERCECLFGQSVAGENPACQYNSFDDILFCHKCQKTMDVIEVYAITNNLERPEAIKELVKQLKIEFGKYDEKYIETEEQIYKLFIDFMEKCHKNLLDSEYYTSIKNKRGFTDKTMEMFKIGLFNDSIKKYINNTYSNKLLHNAGFKNYSKKDKEKRGKLYWILRNDKIVYPYLDRNRAPRYFIYRKIDKEE
nr:MAG: DnaG-like DNA primase [uncultured archaeon]